MISRSGRSGLRSLLHLIPPAGQRIGIVTQCTQPFSHKGRRNYEGGSRAAPTVNGEEAPEHRGNNLTQTATAPASIEELQDQLREHLYVADRGLAISTYLALKLQRPLFLEGEAGVGKTEVAKVLASASSTDLIRLQCYEGLDVNHAVYEWNYARQLLEIRLLEASGDLDRGTAAKDLFSEEFLIKRPLLQAIEASRERPPVLLIDEIDRADEEFEGFLLELLSDFQITIPELGTFAATVPPIVVITSNRTREVHDALKRRCLYYWIEYPGFQKELQIVTTKVPKASKKLAEEVTAFVQELRDGALYKLRAWRRRWTGRRRWSRWTRPSWSRRS